MKKINLRYFTWAVVVLVVISNGETTKEMVVCCADHFLYMLIGSAATILVQTVRELRRRHIL